MIRISFSLDLDKHIIKDELKAVPVTQSFQLQYVIETQNSLEPL